MSYKLIKRKRKKKKINEREKKETKHKIKENEKIYINIYKTSPLLKTTWNKYETNWRKEYN